MDANSYFSRIFFVFFFDFFSRLGIRYLCWLLVASGSFWWLLLASVGFWWLLVAFGGFWWLLVAILLASGGYFVGFW